ncbi:MAG: rRNA maturation RNase YbeY [Gammaproteobacteria bacterium]|nr:rRNA maturation RNase YbeY [Gammaproteobacteria bacterium]
MRNPIHYVPTWLKWLRSVPKINQINQINQIKLILQNDSTHAFVPSKKQFQQWLNVVATAENISGEITLRIVDTEEMQQLNKTYRNKDKPTNVLSFPYEPFPGEAASYLIGDLVICAPVVTTEAVAQNKSALAHWAHLTLHGTLHLLGYDHKITAEAEIMEAKEIAFLQKLGYADPYE